MKPRTSEATFYLSRWLTKPLVGHFCAGSLFGRADACRYRNNLLLDCSPHVFRQKVRVCKRPPSRDCPFRRLDGNFLDRARRQPRRIGEAPHLVDRNPSEAAAAAEVQGELVAGNIGKRRHKIIGRG